MIKAKMSLPTSAALTALLHSESFTHPRAQYEVRTKGKHVEITIEAADAVALKTAVNSLCRVITVHEKAKRV